MAFHSFTRARQRRQALTRLQRLHFFGDPALAFMYTDLTPGVRFTPLSGRLTEQDATLLARQHPGSRVVPAGTLRDSGHLSTSFFRVVHVTRLGAPFRQPAMAWELQEQIQQDEVRSNLREVSRHGRYRGWHANSPGWLKRAFRRLGRQQGREICRHLLAGDEHRAEQICPEGYLGNLHWLVD